MTDYPVMGVVRSHDPFLHLCPMIYLKSLKLETSNFVYCF